MNVLQVIANITASLVLSWDGGRNDNCVGKFALPKYDYAKIRFIVHMSNKFCRYYGDGMVFQSGPVGPTFWGFINYVGDLSACPIKINIRCQSYESEIAVAKNSGNVWTTTLPAGKNGLTCNAQIKRGAQIEQLQYIYGDVFICSGQSNMEFKMRQILNATEELEKAKSYGNIRFLQVGHDFSHSPRQDIKEGIEIV